MAAKYYQNKKEVLQRKACENYQNLQKDKNLQYARK